jgi:hypothetical protein
MEAMAAGTRRLDRPGRDKRMLSFMLIAQGAILVILAVVVAIRAASAGALVALGLGLLLGLVGVFLRSRGS